MLVQFGNNWIQKIPLTAKLDSACGLVQFWLSSEFFSSNYFQIGQHVVLLHIQILTFSNGVNGCILLTFGSIYTNLRDFVKHDLHFMTIWINSCQSHNLQTRT